VVKVGSNMGTYGQTPANLSTADPPVPITIILDALAGTDVDSEETVTITTVPADVPLATADHWYKITITFTASKTS